VHGHDVVAEAAEVRRLIALTGLQGGTALEREPLEAVRVDLVAVQVEPVAGRFRADRRGAGAAVGRERAA
jgi:hypothetical protein